MTENSSVLYGQDANILNIFYKLITEKPSKTQIFP